MVVFHIRTTVANVKRPRRGWEWIFLLIAGAAALAVYLGAPEFLVNDADFKGKPADRYKAVNDVRTSAVQALAALGLFGGLVFTARTFVLNREGQIRDRYSKAVDQLGSDPTSTQVGGVYSLERIMRDSPSDQGPVLETLAAFVRDKRVGSSVMAVDPAVAAALRVMGRRVRSRDPEKKFALNLTECHLHDYSLRGGDFSFANFWHGKLIRVNLSGADLTCANLAGADLGKAVVKGTKFDGADLRRADLNDVDAGEATWEGARYDLATVWPPGFDPAAALAVLETE